MIEAVGSALSSMISWIGSFISALTGTNGALAPLLPLFAIGIAASLCMFAMKIDLRVLSSAQVIA